MTVNQSLKGRFSFATNYKIARLYNQERNETVQKVTKPPKNLTCPTQLLYLYYFMLNNVMF